MILFFDIQGFWLGYMWAKWPDKIGRLVSTRISYPIPGMFYAIDNGAYSDWINGSEFNEARFFSAVERLATVGKPRWIAVPDVVGDRAGTIARWDKYSESVSRYGPLAFVVQDGMGLDDVPENASTIFVGGTTAWKRKTLPMWCASGLPVHVGRVNSGEFYDSCLRLGVESIDGTGWFRGDPAQRKKLFARLEGGRPNQEELVMTI